MDGTFLLVGENLALDLLNSAWGEAGDGLTSPEGARGWLVAAGVLTPQEGAGLAASPPLSRRLLVELLHLREELAGVVDAFSRGTVLPEEGLFALNRVLEARWSGFGVEADGLAVRRVPRVRGDPPLVHLAPVAEAAARLLAEGDRDRLRRCDGPDCRLWFHDVSRNGLRRWCSMARCGNRAKVAAHYRRNRDG